MSVLTTDVVEKQKCAIYFAKGNENVKNFASRVRNDNKVDTLLIWTNQFKDEVLNVDAVVVEHGAPHAEQIERAYRATLPDVEVHYMTPEGTWYGLEEAKPAGAPVLPSAPQADASTDAVAAALNAGAHSGAAGIIDAAADADAHPPTDASEQSYTYAEAPGSEAPGTGGVRNVAESDGFSVPDLSEDS